MIERNTHWKASFATEPFETAWASEAIFFVRILEASAKARPSEARVQISPNGIQWCDEGSSLVLSPTSELAFCRVRHFGGWLRIDGNLPPGESMKVIVYLSLKS